MRTCDAIIVGAGPAGSTCAARLRAAGWNVRLFDKKQFPRVKPCAGWVTPQVIDVLQIDLAEYRRNLTLQPITGFRTGIIGRRPIETRYSHPVSYGILRIEFDNYLLQRSGVACDYTPVRQIERDNGLWRVNGHAAPLIVGAGGHFCPVARLARGVDKGPVESNVVYAQEVEFRMTPRQKANPHVDAATPELYFCPDLTGYGWCFRKGEYMNVGLGRMQKKGLSNHVHQFCEFLRRRHKLVDETPGHFLGHAYRIYANSRPTLFDDGLILIGDAAGLAYPQSGEGIRPAVESAIIAADVVKRAQDVSAGSLAAYATRLTKQLGSPKSLNMAPWVPAAWLCACATRLMATHWFARNTIIDQWFLRRHQRPPDE